MNTSAVGQAIPPWLHDVFLGYGDPGGAHYRSLPDQLTKHVDFGDTLLDVGHIQEVRHESEAVHPPLSPFSLTRKISYAALLCVATISIDDPRMRSFVLVCRIQVKLLLSYPAACPCFQVV